MAPGQSSWSSYSDTRLKKNITSINIESSLDNLTKLKLIEYTHINSNTTNKIPGLDAANVKTKFPLGVHNERIY